MLLNPKEGKMEAKAEKYILMMILVLMDYFHQLLIMDIEGEKLILIIILVVMELSQQLLMPIKS